MANFRLSAADKESLLTTLKKYDDAVNLEEVLDPEDENQSPSEKNTLLLQILLEMACRKLEPNAQIRQTLFLKMWKMLNKSKLISNPIFQGDELADVRVKVASEFEALMLKERNKLGSYPIQSILPNPDNQKMREKIFESPGKYRLEFKELKTIGRGGFGTVWGAEHKVDDVIYAIKKIAFKYKKDSDYLKVIREVKSFATLHHLNVVGYNQAWFEYSPSSANTCSSETSSNSSSPCQTYTKSKVSNFSQTQSSSLSYRKKTVVKANKLRISTTKDLDDDFISFRDEGGDSVNPESRKSNSSQRELKNSSQSTSESFSDSSSFDSEQDSDDNILSISKKSSVRFAQKTCLLQRVMLYIQMEFCDYDLRKWLDRRTRGKQLPFQLTVLEIFRDILNGVAYIHSKSIIHRDLKPQNIFYSKKDKAMKIGDFGLATLSDSFLGTNLETSAYHSSDCGTIPYAAPEQIKKNKYNSKVDMYSLGIILIELLINVQTRMEFSATINTILQGDVPIVLINEYPEYVELVKNLLSKDPDTRLPAKKILTMSPISVTSEANQRDKSKIKFLEEIIAEKDKILAEHPKFIKELEASYQNRIRELEDENASYRNRIRELEALKVRARISKKKKPTY